MAKPAPTADIPEGNVQAWIVGTHELPPHLMQHQSLMGMVVVENRGEPATAVAVVTTVAVLRQEDFDELYEWVY